MIKMETDCLWASDALHLCGSGGLSGKVRTKIAINFGHGYEVTSWEGSCFTQDSVQCAAQLTRVLL